jgi:hypothetical protein
MSCFLEFGRIEEFAHDYKPIVLVRFQVLIGQARRLIGGHCGAAP